jgi:GDP-mannose transporter
MGEKREITPSFDALSPATLSIISYSICSGSLLLVNKLAMASIPSAPLVTSLQCAFCCAALFVCSALGYVRFDPFTWPLLRAYLIYGVLFVIGIYTNMRALESSNVDTVIVFRSTVPLFVAGGDYLWMGREAPSRRSVLSMVLVAAGCAAFVAVDAEFHLKGWAAYGWCLVYTAAIGAEMLFGKAITSTFNASLATSVLLTNAIGVLPFLAIGAATGELRRGLDARFFTPGAVGVLLASCALSAGIGFTSWWCRSLVTATSFTVVGVVNKVLTVLLNILVWSKHASPAGTAFLLLCLAGGAFYEQAPLRGAGQPQGHGGGGEGKRTAGEGAVVPQK